jgi:hypothetical protein
MSKNIILKRASDELLALGWAGVETAQTERRTEPSLARSSRTRRDLAVGPSRPSTLPGWIPARWAPPPGTRRRAACSAFCQKRAQLCCAPQSLLGAIGHQPLSHLAPSLPRASAAHRTPALELHAGRVPPAQPLRPLALARTCAAGPEPDRGRALSRRSPYAPWTVRPGRIPRRQIPSTFLYVGTERFVAPSLAGRPGVSEAEGGSPPQRTARHDGASMERQVGEKTSATAARPDNSKPPRVGPAVGARASCGLASEHFPLFLHRPSRSAFHSGGSACRRAEQPRCSSRARCTRGQGMYPSSPGRPRSGRYI